jgi:hypothetical protein
VQHQRSALASHYGGDKLIQRAALDAPAP